MIHDEPALADDGLHVAGVEGITEVPGEVVLRQRRGGIVVEDDQIVRPAARRIEQARLAVERGGKGV